MSKVLNLFKVIMLIPIYIVLTLFDFVLGGARKMFKVTQNRDLLPYIFWIILLFPLVVVIGVLVAFGLLAGSVGDGMSEGVAGMGSRPSHEGYAPYRGNWDRDYKNY